MENASKALIMAGGVLIGILILSLAAYLFLSFGAKSQEIHSRIDETQLNRYNAQYNIYADRTDITIYDIISLANLAKENEKNNSTYSNYDTDYKVTVILTDGGDVNLSNTNEVLKTYSEVDINGNLKYSFKCDKIEYHSNGRISKIKFTKN